MKTFVVAFAVCFGLMSIGGFWAGRAFVSTPDFIEKYAFSKVRIEQAGDNFCLVYRIGGKVAYVFDVDTNELRTEALDPLEGDLRLEPSPWRAFILSDPSIPKFLGGATLGFTAKDLLTKPELVKAVLSDSGAARRKQIIGGLLGSLTGYAAGYWVATHRALPRDDDQKMIAVLKDQKNWLAKKWSIYANVVHNLASLVSNVDDAQTRQRYITAINFMVSIALRHQPDGPRSQDLRSLGVIDGIIRPKIEAVIKRETTLDWILFWVPVTFFVLSVVIAVGAGIDDFVRKRRRARG